jgi:hypothetical protein
MMQQSELFADRLKRECGDDASKQIVRAFWLCFGREPDAKELIDSAEFLGEQGLPAFCRAVLNSNEFVFLQ